MEEVLEDGDVIGAVQFSVQLDLLVAEYASQLVLRLRLLPALALVLAEELKTAQLLQVIQV